MNIDIRLEFNVEGPAWNSLLYAIPRSSSRYSHSYDYILSPDAMLPNASILIKPPFIVCRLYPGLPDLPDQNHLAEESVGILAEAGIHLASAGIESSEADHQVVGRVFLVGVRLGKEA